MQNDSDLLASIERPGGWLAETTRGASAQGKTADSESVDALAERIARLEGRLKEAKGPQAERIEARLQEARQQQKAQARDRRDERGPATLADAPALDLDTIIREAYLRTLSRRPTPEESEIARAYFGASADGTKGLRDLLWALLNTKEFITNH